MGHIITKPAQRLYWIAKNDNGDVVHVGILETNQQLMTPQPELEVILPRLVRLKILKLLQDHNLHLIMTMMR